MGLGERGNGLVVVFEGLLDESTLVVGPDVVRVDRQRFVRPVQCVVELVSLEGGTGRPGSPGAKHCSVSRSLAAA